MTIRQRLSNAAKTLFKTDSFYDPISGRGGQDDRVSRVVGQRTYKTPYDRMKYYQASGFIQNIIEQPAEDATREFIDVTTNQDEDLKINRLIEKRLEDLGVRKKLKDMVRFSRMYEKGSMIFYGVDTNVPQTDEVLTQPLDLATLNKINYINVIEEPDRFYFFILNRYDPTKADYNKVTFYIMGREVHESRISWIVNNWYPLELMGVSIMETVEDAVKAQDAALWSSASLMTDMATNIFTSDLVSTLSPDKLYELLWSLKNQKNTQSVVGLKPGETFQKSTYSLTGMKEVFDFICDNLSAVSRMPRNILFGKAHGVVTAGEYDTLNYYSNISKFQELELRPVIKQIIDMVIHEQYGEIYKALGAAGVEELDVDFKFKSLYKIDPMSEADMQLKIAQRDSTDIQSGKMSPEEARTLDTRMDELKDFETGTERNESIYKFGNQAATVEKDADSPNNTAAEVKTVTYPAAKAEEEKGLPDVKSNFGFREVSKGEVDDNTAV